MDQDSIHVACPCCSNKRLFGIELRIEGAVRIKCPRYKNDQPLSR